jgi:rhodanese-related sulfurtransferase
MAALVDRDQLPGLVARGADLIEVLPLKEYNEDHLPGARSLPLAKIDRESVESMDRDRDVVVYCWDIA